MAAKCCVKGCEREVAFGNEGSGICCASCMAMLREGIGENSVGTTFVHDLRDKLKLVDAFIQDVSKRFDDLIEDLEAR